MDAFSAQQHLLPAAIFLAMLAVGMDLSLRQFRALIREPRVPVVGTFVHTLTFPLVAVMAVVGLRAIGVPLAEATVLGVLLIAACPSGGFSNILTLMARTNLPLSIVLTAVSSVFSFASVPLLMLAFSTLVPELKGPVALPIGQILAQLALLVLAPVVIGMALAANWRALTPARIAAVQRWTQLALYAVVALVIAENFAVMRAHFFTVLPWSVGLCAVNTVACFGLSRGAGLNVDDAITVALEGSVRNLGVAFLIAANTLERMDIAVLPTVYFLTVLVISIAFAKNWRRLPGFKPAREVT